jgi:hypothetical protein
MSIAKRFLPDSHVVDILGSTKGRDQPIMLMERAVELVSSIDEAHFRDSNTVFLDPFCKAGEILLATALKLCLATKSGNPRLATSEEIFGELYTGRFYGLAPDERHYLLSKRTFYGNELSHVEQTAKHIFCGNYVSEVDGKLNEDAFEREFIKMINYIRKSKPGSKIVAIGNPPYQESDGGAKASAKPVYNYFVEKLIDCGQIEEFSLVIPARWFSGGKGLDSFREKLASSQQIKTLQYFERAEDVFPTVHVQGGVCFLNWKKHFEGNTEFLANGKSTSIDLSKFDIIPDDPASTSIIDKIIKMNPGKSVADIAWSRKPFGLSTDYFQRNREASGSGAGVINCYTKGKKLKRIAKASITVNADKIGQWKVGIPRAYATGARRCTLPAHTFFLIKKDEISTETYNVVGCFETRAEAERLIKYLQTDFARYLLGLRKLTQDIPKDRWKWVPLVDTSEEWTDEVLFDLFKLTKAEREHVRKKVKEWS